MDQFRDHLALVLGKPYFQDWLWISMSVIALVLLYRPTFRTHLKTGTPPGIAALLVLGIFLAIVDYLAYYPGVIPDPHVIVTRERWYPVHAIGLPILAAPVYAVGGRFGGGP